MNILITGVSGFVGEELAYFMQDNSQYKIIGIDKNEEISSKNIIFKKCNLITEKDKLSKIFQTYNPDVVVHCASTILDTYDKDLVWKTNYYATKDLLDICKTYNVKK